MVKSAQCFNCSPKFSGNKSQRDASHLQVFMKFSSKKILIVAVAASLCLGVPFHSFGATVNVSVVNFAFVPAATNIFVGDRVIWTWVPGANFHNVTSTDVPQVWPASATLNGPATFTNTFASVGTFPYECTVHLFTGLISVAAVNVPPSISITNPAEGTVFNEPANVTIQATATDSNSGGSVTNVQFLVGTTVLTNEVAVPFVATANNLAAGSYIFSAVATDNNGLTATNAITISVVTPVPLTLGAPAQLSPTSFQFNYSANVGLSYIVQQSTNLASTNWIAILTNTATSNPVTFVDSNAIANPGFYRVVRLPNP
jgi:plastocyanin